MTYAKPFYPEWPIVRRWTKWKMAICRIRKHMLKWKRTMAATPCGWNTVIRPAVVCPMSTRPTTLRHVADIKWWQMRQCIRTVRAWIAATASGEFIIFNFEFFNKKKKSQRNSPDCVELDQWKRTNFLSLESISLHPIQNEKIILTQQMYSLLFRSSTLNMICSALV